MLTHACARAAGSSAGSALRFLSSDTGRDMSRITIARGDGIGPDILESTLRVLDAAGAGLSYDEIKIGEQVYLEGHSSGIRPDDWTTLRTNPAFLKAPITTPVGKGYKSLNVSIRKTLGLYSNVRPTVSLTPFVGGKSDVNLVCIRENEEDTYAGIEHQQTPGVVQCLKLVSHMGCEKILRYAYDYAVEHGRTSVTVMHKANIMKLTDGLFLEVARNLYEAEYKGKFELSDVIIDIGTALLADQPARFDVVVMPNLYGDIASDVIAQVCGSVGLGGSANIGPYVSMFEAIHGSAPDIAGKDLANPSGLLLGAVQMLDHLGKPEAAAAIQNAWLKTIEDGIHTADIYNASTGYSKEQAGTTAFTDAVIARLGELPRQLPVKEVAAASTAGATIKAGEGVYQPPARVRTLHGVDVFSFDDRTDPDEIADDIRQATESVESLELRLVTSRGVKVWPDGMPETDVVDHWRLRFRSTSDAAIDPSDILRVMEAITSKSKSEVVKTENLYYFDGQPGFSLGQGE